MRRSNGFVAVVVVMLGGIASLVAQRPPVPSLPPSTFADTPGEIWTESGLRAVDDALQVETAGDRARVRLATRDDGQITVEGATFMVDGGANGVVIRSVGRATVVAEPGRRRMEADSVEVWLSPDGWGYLKAVRRPS
jgi:hypothetical protein